MAKYEPKESLFGVCDAFKHVGKDEVGSSNLPSSSTEKSRF